MVHSAQLVTQTSDDSKTDPQFLDSKSRRSIWKKINPLVTDIAWLHQGCFTWKTLSRTRLHILESGMGFIYSSIFSLLALCLCIYFVIHCCFAAVCSCPFLCLVTFTWRLPVSQQHFKEKTALLQQRKNAWVGVYSLNSLLNLFICHHLLYWLILLLMYHITESTTRTTTARICIGVGS